MDDQVEISLEVALQEARLALEDAERQRAEWELRVESLQTEISGVEAALNRRRAAESRSVDSAGGGTPIKAMSMDSPTLPATAAGVGVAALVILLMDVHKNWTNKKRAAAVESVLRAAGRPVHRTEVTEALSRLGRNSDTLEYVSAALAYLNRAGRARPTGDGFWTFTEPKPLEKSRGGESINEQ
jgi:hypothetical protein